MEELQEHYEIVKFLGSGGFGKVVEAIPKSGNGEHVAVKILPKKDYKVAKLLSEAAILSRMKHPNIVQFKGVRETENKLLIEMALINQGPLQVRKYSPEQARTIMRSIYQAVDFIHEHGVVHRDLKPENILVENVNDFSTLKIVDFGLSAGQIVLHGQCGTLLYMAPELFSQRVYSKPIDIWSCGIILYQVLTGKHPLYKGERSHEYKKKLMDPKWEFPDDFDPMAKHLFLKSVALDPMHRYSANQVLQHPWITNKNDPIPLTLPEMYHAFTVRERLVQKIKVMMFFVAIKGIAVKSEYLQSHNKKIDQNNSNLLDKDYVREMLKTQEALKENNFNAPIKEQLRYEKILQRIQENGPKDVIESLQRSEQSSPSRYRTRTNENSQPSSSQKSLNSSTAPNDQKNELYLQQISNKHHLKKRLFKKVHASDKKRTVPIEIPVLRSRSTTANHKSEIKQLQPQHFESPKKPMPLVRIFKPLQMTQQTQHSPIRKPTEQKQRSNSTSKKISIVEAECIDAFRYEQEKVIHSMFMPRVMKNKNGLPFQRNFQCRYAMQPQQLELNLVKPPLPKKVM